MAEQQAVPCRCGFQVGMLMHDLHSALYEMGRASRAEAVERREEAKERALVSREHLEGARWGAKFVQEDCKADVTDVLDGIDKALHAIALRDWEEAYYSIKDALKPVGKLRDTCFRG